MSRETFCVSGGDPTLWWQGECSNVGVVKGGTEQVTAVERCDECQLNYPTMRDRKCLMCKVTVCVFLSFFIFHSHSS